MHGDVQFFQNLGGFYGYRDRYRYRNRYRERNRYSHRNRKRNKKIKEIFFSQKTDTDTAKGKATATETGTVKEKAAPGGWPCFL